jgi:hypothetical protein
MVLFESGLEAGSGLRFFTNARVLGTQDGRDEAEKAWRQAMQFRRRTG